MKTIYIAIRVTK